MLDDRIKIHGDPDSQDNGLEELDKLERENYIAVTMIMFKIVSR